MLKKSLLLLTKNPLLMILFILAILAYVIPMVFFLPETRKILEISKGITENPASASSVDLQQMTTMMLSTMKIYLYLFVFGILGIIFVSGYGNMLAAAVNEGKASLKVFLFGIRKFIGKVILSALLLIAIIIGFSIIISVCTLPFTFAGIAANNFDIENMMGIQKVIQIVTLVITVFLYPLIELWLPAIFLERSDGVMACFRKGFRAGLRKYVLLVAVTAVMILPLIAMYVTSGDLYSIIDSPLYMLSFVYQAIIMPVILVYLFVVYNNGKEIREIIG